MSSQPNTKPTDILYVIDCDENEIVEMTAEQYTDKYCEIGTSIIFHDDIINKLFTAWVEDKEEEGPMFLGFYENYKDAAEACFQCRFENAQDNAGYMFTYSREYAEILISDYGR